MRSKIIGTLIALLMVSATTASAAIKEGAYSVTPLLGGHVYSNDQQFNANLVVGVRAGYNITKAVGVEVLYDYVLPTESKFWSISDITMHRFGGQALYHFLPDKQLVPYLAAGVSGIKFNGSGVNPNIHSSVDYGAGAKYFVTDDIAVRADVRHIIYGYNSTTYNNVQFTLGAYFQFGGVTPSVKALASEMAQTPPPEPNKVVTACAPAPEPEVCPPLPKPIVCAPVPEPTVCAAVVCAPVSESVKMVLAPVTPEACEPLWVASQAKASLPAGSGACEEPADATVLYGSNRVIFKVDYHEELDKVGDFLKKFPNSRVTIAGHTDSSGSKEENLQMSLVRAGVLRSHLIYKFKIDRSRISVKGYGAAKPVASNKTEAGRAKNRRIEVVFNCE